jgi:hypothetical protein
VKFGNENTDYLKRKLSHFYFFCKNEIELNFITDKRFMKLIVLTLLLYISGLLNSCAEKQKPFNDEDIIFFGAPQGNGISALSFSLYKDGRYQIMSSGGIGAYYYSGKFKLSETQFKWKT